MSSLPQIRMRYGWLLSNAASEPMNQLWGDGTPLRTTEEYAQIVTHYQEVWDPYEKKILQAMQDILGLEFRQTIIDVYIAPWFAAFSDPMVIGVSYDPDRFIDVFTHELIHRLITDNVLTPYEYDHLQEWRKLYGADLNNNVLVHIPVHAVHKAIMLDSLNEPTRFEREIDKVKEYPAYKTAWDYVEEHDYKKIIKVLRNLYGAED